MQHWATSRKPSSCCRLRVRRPVGDGERGEASAARLESGGPRRNGGTSWSHQTSSTSRGDGGLPRPAGGPKSRCRPARTRRAPGAPRHTHRGGCLRPARTAAPVASPRPQSRAGVAAADTWRRCLGSRRCSTGPCQELLFSRLCGGQKRQRVSALHQSRNRLLGTRTISKKLGLNFTTPFRRITSTGSWLASIKRTTRLRLRERLDSGPLASLLESIHRRVRGDKLVHAAGC
jgi:hypothetical protein